MATCTFSPKPFLPSLHLSKRPLASISPFSRRISVSASATTTTWTPAPLSLVSPATPDSSIFHVVADLSSSPSLSTSYSAPGQYLQVRISGSETKPAFMAIASPPSVEGRFEFLVKRVPESTAELLCGLKEGDLVELGPVMGKGFQIERIEGPETADTVFIFATGTGISAIRSLIESDFPTNKKADVRLYYGARNLQIMAYQDRFETWESSGVTVVPVLSQPDNSWIGETGYVQNAFLRTKPALNPLSTGVVLCGQKQMAEIPMFGGIHICCDPKLRNSVPKIPAFPNPAVQCFLCTYLETAYFSVNESQNNSTVGFGKAGILETLFMFTVENRSRFGSMFGDMAGSMGQNGSYFIFNLTNEEPFIVLVSTSRIQRLQCLYFCTSTNIACWYQN